MILTKEIEIKINAKNIEYYINLGYKCTPLSKITVKSIDISRGCHKKVLVQCELCKLEKELMICKYWQNQERQGFYSCKQCSGKKRKMTCMEIYGFEFASQRPEQKERMKVWMSSDEFNKKSKETMLEKFGHDHYSKTDEFKSHITELYEDEEFVKKSNETRKQTCLKKYGVESYMLTDEYLEKRAITMNKLYGATHSTQSKIIKEKIRKSFQENWGVDSPFESKEIQEIAKQSVMEKYGVDNVFRDEEIIEKIRKTKIERGYQVDLTGEYKEYRHKILRLTQKVKGELFENWDGYDFYDNEHIKNNLKLHYNDVGYPTIDHMVSVLHGFLNDISPEDISELSNLCITKRSINSKKNSKSIDDFKID